MPRLGKASPLRTCWHPGCPVLVEAGIRFCANHQPRSVRPDIYKTRAWQQYSVAYRREHPLCVACLAHGATAASQVVDHVTPHGGDARLFWDPENHQALCKACHDAKTGKERSLNSRFVK